MGIGYWCFAANVFLTIFQSRLVRVPKPSGHLWKFLATGAAGLTVGHRAGRDPGAAGERGLAVSRRSCGRVDRPDQPRAHQPRHRADDARRGRALLPRSSARAGRAPSRRAATPASTLSSAGSLAFYGSAMYLGFHEGGLVVGRGLTPEQAERATAIHPFLLMSAGHRDVRRVLVPALALVARSFVARRPGEGIRARRLRGARASGRCRGRSRRSRPSTSCSTEAATPAR